LTINRTPTSIRIALLGLALACGLAPNVARGLQFPLLDPPEPTQAELLQAAGVDPDDPDALALKLYQLLRLSPGAIDEAIPRLHQAELDELFDQANKLAVSVPEEQRGAILRCLEADLKQRRPHDVARQVDAILRRLGAVAKPEQFHVANAMQYARTPWGRSKAAAAILDIAARHSRAILGVDDYAYLVRELPPLQAGAIAAEWLDRLEKPPRPISAHEKTPLVVRLWLGDALSGTDPERALRTLAPGLDSRDPAIRLFAGLAIARLGDGRVPFRLTLPPDETREAREAWLAQIQPHSPAPFAFDDPLAAPVVRHGIGGGWAELLWLDENAQVTRRQSDVWPLVGEILPDGTYGSLLRSFHTSALTSPDGETYARFDSAGCHFERRSATFWSFYPGGRQVIEYAPWGEALWALPVEASMAAPAGPGRVLLIRPGVKIVDRRGDVIWAISGLHEDARWGAMIDDDTVVIACQTEIQIHHRTRGLLRTVGGFSSLSHLRYHPDRPWLIWDGSSVIVLDPKTEKRSGIRIAGIRKDSPNRSRFVRLDEQWAE
jgi:hypothetical protein